MKRVKPPRIRRVLHLLLAEAESKLGYQFLDFLQAELDLHLVGLLRVVPVEGPDVDPEAAHF